MERREIVAVICAGIFAIGGAAMIEVATDVFPNQQTLIFWIGASLLAGGVLGLVVLLIWRPLRRKKMSDDIEMGDDNTIYGDVPPRKMGSRNTIVGPTDAKGNTIIPGGTSVGAGAGFDPTSVIIGSGAGANIGRKRGQRF